LTFEVLLNFEFAKDCQTYSLYVDQILFCRRIVIHKCYLSNDFTFDFTPYGFFLIHGALLFEEPTNLYLLFSTYQLKKSHSFESASLEPKILPTIFYFPDITSPPTSPNRSVEAPDAPIPSTSLPLSRIAIKQADTGLKSLSLP